MLEMLIVAAIVAILSCIMILILSTKPKRAANEASAIASIRTIISAQRLWALTRGNGAYTGILELHANQIIDPVLANGEKDGYTFDFSLNGPTTFEVTATPESEETGRRSFYADESGAIRWREGPGAGPDDPLISNK
jgi:type II secretory pathway pseudopilin PulG